MLMHDVFGVAFSDTCRRASVLLVLASLIKPNGVCERKAPCSFTQSSFSSFCFLFFLRCRFLDCLPLSVLSLSLSVSVSVCLSVSLFVVCLLFCFSLSRPTISAVHEPSLIPKLLPVFYFFIF